MGGYPLQNALEGSPLGSARVGVAIAVTLLVGQSVGIDASVLLYKLVVGSLQMLRECRQRRFALVTDAFVNRMLRLVEAGVTPVVVFDGAARYPPKGATHARDARAYAGGPACSAAGATAGAAATAVCTSARPVSVETKTASLSSPSASIHATRSSTSSAAAKPVSALSSRAGASRTRAQRMQGLR